MVSPKFWKRYHNAIYLSFKYPISVLPDNALLFSSTTHLCPQWQRTLVLNDNAPSFSVRTKSPTHCSKCTITNFVLLKQGNKRSWGGISRFLCPFVLSLLLVHRSLFKLYLLPLSCRGAGGESFSRPLYILYNKVYPPLSQLLLSLLPSFFLFFLKNLSYSFAGLRKSHTFALAKREQLLHTGGVGFLTRIKKEFFDRFS